MARKPDMTIDQLVRKLEHANSVHVKSINAATPLLLGLNAGESFAKKLSAQIGGGTVTITHDSSTSSYHVVVSDRPTAHKAAKPSGKKQKNVK